MNWLLAVAAVLVCVGVGLVYVPAGVIAAGLSVGGCWWLLQDVDDAQD